jgi:ornithine decarboxylase
MPRSWVETAREGAQLLKGAYQLDHSTSIGDLGSLFVWQGDRPVQQLKRRIAAAYGAAWSFPSTHGTTILNVLALLTACPAGGRVLVNRDAHTSVTAALIQGGLDPVYLVPPYDADLGLAAGPTAAAAAGLLARERVDCVFLTSPNYFGIVGELGPIIECARQRGLPVVVDAAHAPHFHFCSRMPDAAEDLGADLVCQSTHKVASALSQGSVLLLNDERFIAPLYEHVNDLGLVSTSFSYPILSSVELGVLQLLEEGERLWSDAIDRADRFREVCRAIPGVACFGREQIAPSRGVAAIDATRVTIDVSGTGLTGFEVERRLGAERIYPELSTIRHVLFLVTPGTSDADLDTLGRTLDAICRRPAPATRRTMPAPPRLPEMAVLPRTAKFSPKRTAAHADAVGAVSGETIATYPPGAPVIAAGEIVSAEVVDYLECLRSHGAILKGAADPSLRTVRVLA